MDIINFLLEPYQSYSNWQIALEVIASFLGIASVIFSARKNILVYPTGIVSTVIYVYLLFGWGLYGDTLINGYYTAMSIYGWYMWSRVDENNVKAPISRMNKQDVKYGFLIFCSAILFVLVVYHFKPYIQSGFDSKVLANLPEPFYWLEEDNIPFDVKIQYVDTFTTGLFLVGMWLMARVKIEHWFFWIVGDLIAIPMYLYRGFGITALQYFIFLIPAIAGYFMWRKDFNKS